MDWKAILKKLAESPKFLALLAGLITVILVEFGVGLDEKTVLEILGLLSAYIIGKGIEDARRA